MDFGTDTRPSVKQPIPFMYVQMLEAKIFGRNCKDLDLSLVT